MKEILYAFHTHGLPAVEVPDLLFELAKGYAVGYRVDLKAPDMLDLCVQYELRRAALAIYHSEAYLAYQMELEEL